MKGIFETSVYLIIMTIICLISIDFVCMNISVSKVSHTEKYIEEYIEAVATNGADNTIDAQTIANVKEYLSSKNIGFSYEYVSSTESNKYYRIALEYSLDSRMFQLGKKHTYDGMVAIAV